MDQRTGCQAPRAPCLVFYHLNDIREASISRRKKPNTGQALSPQWGVGVHVRAVWPRVHAPGHVPTPERRGGGGPQEGSQFLKYRTGHMARPRGPEPGGWARKPLPEAQGLLGGAGQQWGLLAQRHPSPMWRPTLPALPSRPFPGP